MKLVNVIAALSPLFLAACAGVTATSSVTQLESGTSVTCTPTSTSLQCDVTVAVAISGTSCTVTVPSQITVTGTSNTAQPITIYWNLSPTSLNGSTFTFAANGIGGVQNNGQNQIGTPQSANSAGTSYKATDARTVVTPSNTPITYTVSVIRSYNGTSSTCSVDPKIVNTY